MFLGGSRKVKPADFTEGSQFLKAMPLVISPTSVKPHPPFASHFPPLGSQQGNILNHFVLYLEKLPDKSFGGLHKSVSSNYRAEVYSASVLLTLEVRGSDSFSRQTSV